MRYWLIILLLILQLPAFGQEYRDVKSWLSDMDIVESEKIPSVDLRKYEYSNGILQPLIPSLSFSEKYEPIFNSEQLQLKKTSKLFNYMNQSNWKPNNKLSIEGGNLGYGSKSFLFAPKNLTGIDLKANYKITNKLSINAYGYFIANDYKNPIVMPSTLFRSEIGTNLSYSITKNLKIKAGMQYQYNTISRRWEYAYLGGITLFF